MKKQIVALFVTTLFAGQLFAETTCSAVDTVNTSIEELSKSVENQQQLVSKLSDDIGIMADRIGVMADRIVYTEELLADTLVVLTGNADLGSGSDAGSTVALLKPLDGSTASKTTPPTIELSNGSTKYLLYASLDPTFSDGNTISLYIESASGLNTSWQQVVSFAGSSSYIYIAVKSVDENNKISSLSNGVKLTLE